MPSKIVHAQCLQQGFCSETRKSGKIGLDAARLCKTLGKWPWNPKQKGTFYKWEINMFYGLMENPFNPQHDFYPQALTTYLSQRLWVRGWAPGSRPGRAAWRSRRAQSALKGPSSKSAWGRRKTKQAVMGMNQYSGTKSILYNPGTD